MTTPLLVVAASGLAREVMHAVRTAGCHEVVGVVDEDPDLWGTELDGVPVIGPQQAVEDHPPDTEFVLCPGNGRARLAAADRLARKGVVAHRWARVVHPSACLAPDTVLGPGSVVLAGVVATAGVRLGRHVVLMPGVVLTHDDILEDGVTCCAGVLLGGSVRVGQASYLGMGASVRHGVSIGPGVVVGMGAVVLGDVEADRTVVGVPARVLSREPDAATRGFARQSVSGQTEVGQGESR